MFYAVRVQLCNKMYYSVEMEEGNDSIEREVQAVNKRKPATNKLKYQKHNF